MGGQIIRDSNGEPTGVLIDNAMDVVFETVGEPSVEQLEVDIVTALKAVAATGMTATHDAGISAREAQAYRNLQAQGQAAHSSVCHAVGARPRQRRLPKHWALC